MKHDIKIKNIFPVMGVWGVFMGLRIFFLKIFHTKIKSVQNGSHRPGQKVTTRADTRRPGAPLVYLNVNKVSSRIN